jgi:hypothetical protein
MARQYFIFVNILNLIGSLLQNNYTMYVKSGFLYKKNRPHFFYLESDQHIKYDKNIFKPRPRLVDLNKFSELDITKNFHNYAYLDFFEQAEIISVTNCEPLEILYGLNPWDKKFFQRLKTNFNFYKSEIFILLGLEELYSFDKYLSGVNLIIDLEILF